MTEAMRVKVRRLQSIVHAKLPELRQKVQEALKRYQEVDMELARIEYLSEHLGNLMCDVYELTQEELERIEKKLKEYDPVAG